MAKTELTEVPRRPDASSARLAILGLVLCAAAIPLYMVLLDVAFLRSTGLPAFVLLAAGAALGTYAAKRDRRGWVKAVGVLNPALLVLFVLAFFWGAALPAPTSAAQVLNAAPDFTLKDHRNRAVSLRDEVAKGPVLLVFYRGHW